MVFTTEMCVYVCVGGSVKRGIGFAGKGLRHRYAQF